MSATELYERQLKYDLLHHRRRIATLKRLPVLDDDSRRLLERSEMILAHPSEGYNSVNLGDTEYINELDAFAAEEAASDG